MRAFVAATMQKFALQEKGCQRGGSMANRLGGPDRARPGVSARSRRGGFAKVGSRLVPFPRPPPSFPASVPALPPWGPGTLVHARCIPALSCLGPAQRVVAQEPAPP